MKRRAEENAEMRGEQARAWVVRLASGTASVADLEAFESWNSADPRNRAAFLRERAAWRDLAALEDAFASEPEARAETVHSKGRRRWPLLLPAAAAAAMAWVAAPAVWLWASADARTAAGEIREVRLADGSRAMLDSASAIAVDYDRKERTIRLLKGRAWFAVHHGDPRPFRVTAAGGAVRDIGTAFEVDDTTPHTRVGVTEGAAEMEGSRLILRAGQVGEFGSGGGARLLAAGPADAIAGWRQGELLLREVPLDAAIRTLARYRRAPVLVLGGLAGEAPISGSFRTDRPDEALDTLAAMRGLERARLPGGILLLRRAAGRSPR